MALTLEQKLEIIGLFPKLEKRLYKGGRISYLYYGAKRRRKIIISELSHTGNGYIYGKYLPELAALVDARGWISIKDCSENELRQLIIKVIESFS